MDSHVLILVDAQEKLISAMEDRTKLVNNLEKLVKGFNLYNLPIILTEQVPNKLGKTVNQLMDALKGRHVFFSKSEFSCLDNELFIKNLETINLESKLILCGIETHICIYQTARDFIANNYNVEIVTDGISSRRKNDNDTALKMIKDLGAGLTTVEMLLFDIQKNAKNENFKKLSKIIK